jgi:hypothetical protein
VVVCEEQNPSLSNEDDPGPYTPTRSDYPKEGTSKEKNMKIEWRYMKKCDSHKKRR